MEEELPLEHNPYRDITFYTGVGKCNATLKALELIYERSPTLIINFGTAGTCNDTLSGLVECGIFVDRDDSATFNNNARIITNPNLFTLSTGDNFVTSKIDKCDVVDMEAYCIAKACQKHQIKFKCFKYITDYVNEASRQDWNVNISRGYPIFLEEVHGHIKNTI